MSDTKYNSIKKIVPRKKCIRVARRLNGQLELLFEKYQMFLNHIQVCLILSERCCEWSSRKYNFSGKITQSK